MERPTTKQVAFELDFATQPIETGSQGEWHLCAHRLAREVLALQAELVLAQPLYSRRQLEKEVGELRAQVANDKRMYVTRKQELDAKLRRVEALLPKWRGKKPRGTGTMTTGEVAVVQYAFQDAAEDLEAALKGGV